MTTYISGMVSCGVCGNTVTFDEVTSTVTVGSPDLDLRPPPLRKQTLHTWVVDCPMCGYCAERLGAEPPANVEQILVGDAYQALVRDTELPALARRFRRASLIASGTGDMGKAALHTMCAAWACDDDGAGNDARALRGEAADLLLSARREGQRVFPDAPASVEWIVLVDLLRRAGQPDRALALAIDPDGWRSDEQEAVEAALQFERHLIEHRDEGSYSYDDAVEWYRGRVS